MPSRRTARRTPAAPRTAGHAADVPTSPPAHGIALVQSRDFVLVGDGTRYLLVPRHSRAHYVLSVKCGDRAPWSDGALVVSGSGVVAFGEHLPIYGLELALRT